MLRIFRTLGRLVILMAVVLAGAAVIPAKARAEEGGPAVSVTPLMQVLAPDALFDISVEVDLPSGQTRGAQTALRFDPAVMRVESVQRGPLYVDWVAAHPGTSILQYPNPTINNSAGTVSDWGLSIMGSVPGGPSGSGVAFIYHCRALAAGASTIRLVNVNISDEGGAIIPSDGLALNQGLVVVGATTQLDWGDARDPTYPTLATHAGAFHVINPVYYLGVGIDTEADGLPEPQALGDDMAGLDDEDGITYTTPLVVGQSVGLDARSSGPGTLNAWADWDQNGSWADSGEHVIVNSVLFMSKHYDLPVPPTAMPGPVVWRFRFGTQNGLSFEGGAANGEVEDYVTQVLPAVGLLVEKTLIDPAGGIATVGEAITYQIRVENTGATELVMASLTDSYEPGLGFVAALQDGAPVAVSPVGNTVSWDLAALSGGPIASGQAVVVGLTFEALSPGMYTNDVQVLGQNAVEQQAVALDSAEVEIVLPPIELDVRSSLVQPAGGAATLGDPVHFRVEIENRGGAPFVTLPFTDSWDAGLSLVDVLQDGDPVSEVPVGNTIAWDVASVNQGPLLPGQTVVIDLHFTAVAPGTSCNLGTAVGQDEWERAVNDQDQACVMITSPGPTADLNGDGCVDINDVVRLGLVWGQTGAPGWIPEDLNSDGDVDINDVVVIGLHWSEGCTP